MTDEKTPEDTIVVRATINLAGLRAGATALVDPAQPYIADCLKAGYLIPEDASE